VQEAQAIQLQLEYAPKPPFDAGDPDTAPLPILKLARERAAENFARRAAIVARVVATIGT